MSDHFTIGAMPSPESDTHDIDGLNCWCSPDYYLPCDCVNGCWKCDGGKIALTHTEAVAAAKNGPILVVHHR